MNAARSLRDALRSGGPVVAPVCYDPLSSRLVERLGFPAAYLGGGALGYVLNTTEAMLTLSEVVATLRLITVRTSIPIIVDGTTGFGDPLHVIRTVREIEHAGAAAIELEDQLVPKRAHHHRGIDHPIPMEAMVDKIRAAVEARRDADFMIIARTNTVRQISLEEGIRRANAYAEAGADMIMIFPRTEDEYRLLPKEIAKPLALMTFAIGRRLPFTFKELAAMGYPLIIEPQGGLIVAYAAMREALQELRDKDMISFDPEALREIQNDINEAVDLPYYWSVEERTVEH
jgi:methylisocitrate lyase